MEMRTWSFENVFIPSKIYPHTIECAKYEDGTTIYNVTEYIVSNDDEYQTALLIPGIKIPGKNEDKKEIDWDGYIKLLPIVYESIEELKNDYPNKWLIPIEPEIAVRHNGKIIYWRDFKHLYE